jgi:hypothetical protein
LKLVHDVVVQPSANAATEVIRIDDYEKLKFARVLDVFALRVVNETDNLPVAFGDPACVLAMRWRMCVLELILVVRHGKFGKVHIVQPCN